MLFPNWGEKLNIFLTWYFKLAIINESIEIQTYPDINIWR